MKTKIFFKLFFTGLSILCIVSSFGLFSCSDDTDTGIPSTPAVPDKELVEFISKAPVFSSAAGSQEIEFKSSGNWTASADQPWCSVSPTSGGAGTHTLTVNVEANEGTYERNVGIAVKTKTNEQRITLAQKQLDAVLLSSNKGEISSESQQVKVEIKANIDYQLSIDEKAKGWISEEKSRGLQAHVHTFNITQNDNATPRQGKIFIESSTGKEIYTVYQQAGEDPQLILGENEQVVDHNKNTVKIELQSNIDYQMILPEKENWIHEQESRSLSSFTRYITVDPNESDEERSADILFVYGKEVELFTIIQKPKDAIILAKKDYIMNIEGGELYFTIASNTDYQTTCDASWIKQATTTRGMMIKEMHFTVSPNTTDNKRTGKIRFFTAQTEQIVTVVQNGKSDEIISFLNDLHTFDSKGGTQQLSFETQDSWTVTSLEDWCKVGPTSGKRGSHKINISVDENSTTDERNVGLVFTVGNIEKMVTVTQKQKDALLISSAKAEIKQEGGQVSFDVQSNINCTVTVSPDASNWVTPLESRVLRKETYVFNISENTGFTPREASIEIVGNGLKEVFKIYQEGKEGPTLILSQKEVFLDNQAQQFSVELKSNAKYTISIQGSNWLHEDRSRSASTFTHHFRVDENTNWDREARIIFATEGKSETLWVYQDYKTYSPNCIIHIVTTNTIMTVPLCTGNKEVTGFIDWDGNSVPYSPDFVLNFSNKVGPQNYSLLKMNNTDHIYFDNINGLRNIKIIGE